MRGRAHQAGFTLVEMAVVLIIVGLLILTVFPALLAVRSASQRNATQTNLHSLMQATAAFVQANDEIFRFFPAVSMRVIKKRIIEIIDNSVIELQIGSKILIRLGKQVACYFVESDHRVSFDLQNLAIRCLI